MTALGTAFFYVIAVGLLVEGAVAWRRRRVLRGPSAAFAYGFGALGVVAVLSKAVGPGRGGPRQLSGWVVAAAFICCIGVDLANRKRLSPQVTTPPPSAN